MVDYAIIQTGGKQYRVAQGKTIRVEKVPGELGDRLDLDDVRVVARNGDVTLGTPGVPGASVKVEVVGLGRRKKIVVFKYKAKTRYRRKNGHRQAYTDLRVVDISFPQARTAEGSDGA